MPAPFDALVLAAARSGPDPVAAAAGVSHKALAPVAGMAMLERVLIALRASDCVGRIEVVAEPGAAFDAAPALAAAMRAAEAGRLASAGSPAASVLAALEAGPPWRPRLVVTADHALLNPGMIARFCAGVPAGADLATALAPAATVLAAYPDAVRTLIRFSDGPFSGCNLFALCRPDAARAVRVWLDVELHRKRPWRLVRALGPGYLARYLAGTLDSAAAMRRLSAVLGARAERVELPIAEAAIDIDKPADLALAERILARAEAGRAPGAWNRG